MKIFIITPFPEAINILIENNTIQNYTWIGLIVWEGKITFRNNIIRNGTGQFWAQRRSQLPFGGNF